MAAAAWSLFPPSRPYDAAAQARASELFQKGCAPCHGATARGDGAQKQVDSKGYPTRPRDLTVGVFKGSPDPQSVYRRIVAGLPGSPMPQSGYLQGSDAWHLVHFVRSLSSDAQRAKVEMKQFRIVATRVPQLPTHPDSGVWRDTPAVNLHMMPLWWRTDRPEEITVRAVHDGKTLAMLLKWEDDTRDATAIRPQDFRDSVAVEFALAPDPPFFAMGQPGAPVNIWMWKAERQADMEPAFQELDKIYPNIGIDSYPNSSKSPLEQPTRNALTLQSDPAFVTAWGAGNIVADPTRHSAAENLTAQGFGTLKAHPRASQSVVANGEHTTGSYLVQFTRALSVPAGEVALSPGGTRTGGLRRVERQRRRSRRKEVGDDLAGTGAGEVKERAVSDMHNHNDNADLARRRFLQLLGAGAALSLAGLDAGCRLFRAADDG